MDQNGGNMLPAKAVYTVNYFGLSAVTNFLTVFFSTYFNKFEIGVLQTIPCICSIIAPPLWGAIADILRKQRLVHILCIATGAMLMFSIQFTASSFYLTCFIVFLANFQSGPTSSLLDQAVLALTERVGAEYGKQRLFGAIGWGLGAYVTGVIVSTFGITWAFNLHLLFCLPTILVLQMIPPIDSADDVKQLTPNGSDTAIPSFSTGFKALLKKVDVLILLFVVFLAGLMFGVLSSFLTLNLYELSGHNAQIVGIAIWCETFSELPAFYFADRIIQKVGTVNAMAISILSYGARLTFYALMTNPWYALPFEFLHGCTFSLAWAACTKYIYEAAPRGTEGMMMGILNAVQNGLGRGVGTMVGGYLYNTYGASFMWKVTDLGVPVALLGLYVFSCAMQKEESDEKSNEKTHLIA
ncbi:Major Facilitator Superfamily (MFS) [Thraustotheca clavata]|uniref:Major Facilitator Superfamily (MFS) n=1 Tax=Thraustotheca clavata TaxID=74557 RepID=A0A1V9ZDV2_9STRA|nr:Major Facilitator Superfamily (MFS) [Thraustotheca clavata]